MALSSPALTLHHQDVRTHGVWLRTAKSASNVASGRGHAKTTTCRFSIIPVGRKHHAGSRGRVHPGGLVEAVRRREGPCVCAASDQTRAAGQARMESRCRAVRPYLCASSGGRTRPSPPMRTEASPSSRPGMQTSLPTLPISAWLSVLFFGVMNTARWRHAGGTRIECSRALIEYVGILGLVGPLGIGALELVAGSWVGFHQPSWTGRTYLGTSRECSSCSRMSPSRWIKRIRGHPFFWPTSIVEPLAGVKAELFEHV